ncbi:MAG: hypothetical protein R2856_15725 [Caldilineaceae bacterium]
MPGLIDVHVHITADGGSVSMSAVLAGGPQSFTDSALAGANALHSLRCGYTMRCAIFMRRVTPTWLCATPSTRGPVGWSALACLRAGLCITGGHMDKLRYPQHVTVAGESASAIRPTASSGRAPPSSPNESPV